MNTKTVFTNELSSIVQLELFPPDLNNKKVAFLTLNNKNKQMLLGQIFTPFDLAKFMVSLFSKEINTNHRILDPCIGPNTFLSILDYLETPHQIVGVEIDESLISNSIKDFFSQPGRKLIIDSFFNLPLSEKFDFIIENPPYVRQELMMNGENSKLLALQSLSTFSQIISSKSNLYVYFILKSILHLKDEGRMIAVIYDSWLYSKFGKFLKEMFLRLGSIQNIYHFKKNVFPDADVGATVIDFKRTIDLKLKNNFINFYSFNSLKEISPDSSEAKVLPKQIPYQDFLSFRFNEDVTLDFKTDLFIEIEKLSSQPIQRGISSIANKYFIQPQKTFEEAIPFIKDVSTIRSFKVPEKLSYLLFLNERISTETKKYLDYVKQEILSAPEKFKALKARIESNKIWYKVQLKNPGNILFNYYLRKNIDFFLNNNLHYASDNFYILNVGQNLLANFAILNSSFTTVSVLLHSRNQGNGLRKIQLYEFKEIPVIDAGKLSDKTIEQLEILGEKLKFVDRFSKDKENVINEIDEILLKEYNLHSKIQISIEQFYNDLQNVFSIN